MLSREKREHMPSLQTFIIFLFLNIFLWFFFHFSWRSYTQYVQNRFEFTLIN